MPSISVIMPVYQAEGTLRASVESVLSQTFEDWELLLVDDGSRDGSAALCDAFAAKEGRVRVVHKENGGVSSARNAALREAKGACVAFLDADDRYLPETLETLWYLRESCGADSAGCAHFQCGAAGERRVEPLLPAGVYDAAGIRKSVLLPLAGERIRPPIFNGFIWRFLFDAVLIRKHAIAFEGAYLEDEIFLLDYFSHASRLAVTETPLYEYWDNPASATHRYMADYPQVFARFLERKEAAVARGGLDEDCPAWRENTVWAGLLIAVANEFTKDNPKSVREKRRTVERLCAQGEYARAIERLHPKGLGRSKQIVADLICGGRFGTLALLYRLKNRL
ncbi:MAG: glycosyltransferase [Oscillibacter sp.]|nr:glycosyltransferase [Oscillibacter sp.]